MRGDGSLNKAPAQRRTVFDMDAGGPTGSDMRGETFPVRQLGGRAMGTENGERTLSTGVKMMSSRQPCQWRKVCRHHHVALAEESDGARGAQASPGSHIRHQRTGLGAQGSWAQIWVLSTPALSPVTCHSSPHA